MMRHLVCEVNIGRWSGRLFDGLTQTSILRATAVTVGADHFAFGHFLDDLLKRISTINHGRNHTIFTDANVIEIQHISGPFFVAVCASVTLFIC